MPSPEQISHAFHVERADYPGQPKKAGEPMAGSSPANSLKMLMVVSRIF
jgi:hypothetical protein